MSHIAPPPPTRGAASLPNPNKPAGTADPQMPFDHLVVVMMENHSFDNLLGALPRSESGVDGLTFDSSGNAINSNPPATGDTPVTAFPFESTAQGTNITQTWTSTHEQIARGQMTGFIKSAKSDQPMGYYTPEVLPFAYSLASHFTVGNR